MKGNYEIKNDNSLLDKMLKDMKNQSPLYKPGPYWSNKSKNAVNEIKRCGLEDFRGSSSLIGLSFADNLYIDYRDTLNYGFKGRFLKYLTNHYPFKNIFKGQISWTENYANRTIELFQELINLKPEVRDLIKKYNIPYSLIGGCKTFVEIDGIKYSSHYLNILEQHDKIATHISFKKIKSVFEIGGGFGIYIHLLIENYPNIRKVIYLDIPPNLYVGSQYLKAFYNDAVVDYKKSRELNQIEFSDDNNLEIFCVAPW